MSDDVLLEALQHAENRAIPLLHWLAQERGIRLNPANPKKNGTVCDIRIGHEEKNPSLSFRDTSDGAVYKRHGGDDFSGGAVDFVAECLGIERKQAADELIRRAGLSEKPKNGGKRPKEKPKRLQRPVAPPSPSPVLPSKVQAEAVGSQLSADELSQHMPHWEDFDPARHGDVAAHLKRRGLLEAALCGLLVIKVQRGKFAFGVMDPHGQLVTFKARDLKEDAGQRYTYVIPGKGSPAWCSPDLMQKEREIWIEGELNGAALASVLHGTDIGVQGMAGANAKPYTLHLVGQKKVVFIYADPDDAGKKARDEWHKMAIDLGHTVIQLPETTFKLSGGAEIPDACDVLGQLGPEKLLERVRLAMLALESAQVLFGNTGYAVEGNSILQLKLDNRSGKWERVILTDFVAIIKEQLKSADATGQTTTEYRLTGRTRQNTRLPQIVVLAADFTASSKVLKQHWGSEATILGRKGNWEHVVGAIELFSKAVGIKKSVVIKHTGWHEDGKLGWVYVTNGSVIGQTGAVTGVNVALPASLERVRLPEPPAGNTETAACRHSLALLDLAPDLIGIPTLGALYHSPLGTLNATVILHGGTGLGKTTFLALVMAHFGADFDADRPGLSWESTTKQLTVFLHAAKDIISAVDDHKPHTKSRRAAEDSVGKFNMTIQAVADGGGVGSLTANREERAPVSPRGTLITSAEDIPTGHSNQARCVLIPVKESLFGERQELSNQYRDAADRAREGMYASAMSGYVHFLASRYEEVRVGSPQYREHLKTYAVLFPGAHARNGTSAAKLSYGWRVFLSYAVQIGAIGHDEAERYWEKVCRSLRDVAAQQGTYHEEQDLVAATLQDLHELLGTGEVFLRNAETGGAPSKKVAELAGWYPYRVNASEEFDHKTSAAHVGWLQNDGKQYWAMFLPRTLYAALELFARRQNRQLPAMDTLWALLRDRLHGKGLMKCDVEKRKSTTFVRRTKKVRIKHNGREERCIVLAFPLSSLHSGIGGNSGSNDEKGASGAAETGFPPLLLIGDDGGNSGNAEPLSKLPRVPEEDEDATHK